MQIRDCMNREAGFLIRGLKVQVLGGVFWNRLRTFIPRPWNHPLLRGPKSPCLPGNGAGIYFLRPDT